MNFQIGVTIPFVIDSASLASLRQWEIFHMPRTHALKAATIYAQSRTDQQFNDTQILQIADRFDNYLDMSDHEQRNAALLAACTYAQSRTDQFFTDVQILQIADKFFMYIISGII